jgi:GDP-mannose 6-dehydrogenase
MRINVYGLGYVGSVSAACLAAAGHDVLGIDVDRSKVDSINRGLSSVIEPGLEELIKGTVASGKLRAAEAGEPGAQLSLVCVGTPSNDNGSLCLDFVKRAAGQIGDSLAKAGSYHVVCVRSTVLPGTVENVVIPLLEAHSGLRAGQHFGVCMNPEFLREGSSIHDYYHPPLTVIGEFDRAGGDVVESVYSALPAPLVRTKLATAEMVKYVANIYHALKITFANEVGNLAKQLGLDGRDVMEIFCRDDKLNISTAYFKPGFAFGGSCLPKDVRAILHRAGEVDVEVPVLRSILPSNRNQIDHAFRLIKKTGKKHVAMLGLSFKPGTDDLRESPIAELTEMLIGKGYDVSIYDREVSLARLHGSNKAYIEHTIPHISSLLKSSVEAAIEGAEVVVVAKRSPEFGAALEHIGPAQHVVDLAGYFDGERPGRGAYEGICW